MTFPGWRHELGLLVPCAAPFIEVAEARPLWRMTLARGRPDLHHLQWLLWRALVKAPPELQGLRRAGARERAPANGGAILLLPAGPDLPLGTVQEIGDLLIQSHQLQSRVIGGSEWRKLRKQLLSLTQVGDRDILTGLRIFLPETLDFRVAMRSIDGSS